MHRHGTNRARRKRQTRSQNKFQAPNSSWTSTQSSSPSDKPRTPSFNAQPTGYKAIPSHGTICVNEVGKTSLDGVYAGGDVATGAATVISAMGAGKRAAKAMHEYLMNKK